MHAEELLWEKWLMLLQLLIHPGKLQGPAVEVLNWSDGAQMKAEQGPEGSYQGGPGGSLSV